MKIKIAERLKPFSHTPGAQCYLPGTTLAVEAFPALIRLGRTELHLQLTGPVGGFTLEQDLEKNCVFVFGKAKGGFYRLKLEAGRNGVELTALNAPASFAISGTPLRRKEKLSFPNEGEFFLPPVWERLSLGVSKAQDWDLVWRRFDLREILPVLFGLGQKVPHITKQKPLSGTGRLLEEGNLEDFCRTAFSKILVPRFNDEDHQGLSLAETPSGPAALLLREAAKVIRGLFFRQEKEALYFLPDNPFPSGRMILHADGIGEIALEWASRAMRRAILRPSVTTEVEIHLPKGFARFRIGKGRFCSSGERFAVEAGRAVFLDRFQK